MPKGYWIGRVDVADTERYKAYIQANAVAFKKFGAKFLVRAGHFDRGRSGVWLGHRLRPCRERAAVRIRRSGSIAAGVLTPHRI